MNLQQLQEAGFNDQEIGAYVSSKRPNLISAGFSEDEVNRHFGITDVAIPDEMAVSHKPPTLTEPLLTRVGKALTTPIGPEAWGEPTGETPAGPAAGLLPTIRAR